MNRTTRYLLFALVPALFAVGSATIAWLAGTTEGVSWLLKEVSSYTMLKVSARRVEGRILDHLHLGGVRIASSQVEIELDSLDLRWQPLLLLIGRVAVKELTLQGMRIRDNTPARNKPLLLAWPRLPVIGELFEGKIACLQVHGLDYLRLDQQPVTVTMVSASVAWRDAILSVSDLGIESPAGQVAGSIVTGFHRPSLLADLAITPAHPIASMNHLSLHARLLPGRGSEQLAGNITIAGRSGTRQYLELAGEVGMTKNAFTLRHLRLAGPGLRGLVTVEGTLSLATLKPLLTLHIRTTGLDLTPELNVPTHLSGTLTFTGNMERYRGSFALANMGNGWQTARIAGMFQGNAAGVRLGPFTGSLLDGAILGNLDVDWRKGVALRGAISARSLNPANIAEDWTGAINFDLTGDMAWSKQTSLQGRVSGKLLESRLHGKALTGEIHAVFANGNLRISRLDLKGKGFDIKAAGDLQKRLVLAAHISDLSRLIPRTAGELRANGWIRWHDRLLTGSVTGNGRRLAGYGVRIAAMELSAWLEERKGYPLHIMATLRRVLYNRLKADAATLEADGTILRHTVHATLRSAAAEAHLSLSGGYRQGRWRGEIARLSGRDSTGPWVLQAPAQLSVSAGRVSLSTLVLTGVPPERVEVAGDLTRKPWRGFARATWGGMNLARVNPWLKGVRLTGSSSGNLRLSLAAGKHLVLAGSISTTGTVTMNRQRVTVKRSLLSLEGNERGLLTKIDLDLAEGGMLKGSLSSPTPASLALPGKGIFALEWAGLNLAILAPWLPAAVKLEGLSGGQVAGKLLPGSRLELTGDSTLSLGRIHWQRKGGELNLNLRTAAVSWSWRGGTLEGDVTLALTEYGQVRGSFRLPLPARLPPSLDPQGTVKASITGRVQEKGMLAAAFPGVIQETHGDIDIDLRVSGSWEKPKIEGQLHLVKAGAYFPSAGIHIKDVQLSARLDKDTIRIDTFQIASGPGHLNGAAVINLKGWQVASYRGSINGERFQIIYLPELQVLSAPQLTFEGTPERLAVRGEIRLPELLIYSPPARKAITPSKDVIIEGEPPPAEKTPRLALDIQVRMVFGDRVLVKAEGIDAQLGGTMDLSLESLDKITSKGEIKVVKGSYKTYGVDLKIERGRFFYAGGPIDQPTLDILALRTVGEVRAGVTVVGTPRTPTIKLYSKPAMPDVDVLAYIVLGHPLGSSSGEQASLMAKAAGALLSAGQSVVLQDQIKQRLGLSTLEIQTAGGEVTGLMGYKEVKTAPPGTAPAKQATGISQTMLTVGKYLTPQLYISYGRSIFTGGNLFRLRYDVSKHWQVQTETGSESGVDVYYKLDFN